MMTKQVTDLLKIQYPIIQAPMAWLTDAKLVAAVGEAGGLGILGPNAGQDELTSDPIETAERMRQEIIKVRQLTDRPFGVMVATPWPGERIADNVFTREMLKMLFEAQVHYFAVVGSVNAELFDLIKAHLGLIIYRALTPTVVDAKQAESLGADLIVATGRDEGGLLPAREYGTFTVVPAVVDAVSVPVLAAGGVNDRRGVKAAFALGAQGVYVGTRFMVTRESPLAKSAKQLIVDSTYDQVAEVSLDQRSITTKLARQFAQAFQQPSRRMNMDSKINQAGGLRPAMRLGNLDEGIVEVNTGIDTIHDVPTVAELVERLMMD
ncbi:MAG: nitronate monooxygenase [Lentilactobacillus diolivorans]|uniref:NAD(P)H-dependent flavin oxidoreductase n=1 Tax=Lentilactobacillus diolivorans TaxID=179838 RepID=UPI0039E7677E